MKNQGPGNKAKDGIRSGPVNKQNKGGDNKERGLKKKTRFEGKGTPPRRDQPRRSSRQMGPKNEDWTKMTKEARDEAILKTIPIWNQSTNVWRVRKAVDEEGVEAGFGLFAHRK